MTEFDKVIHPGGVGKVTASIHTTNFKGDVTKSVTVTTNDPDNKSFVLQLKAKILVPIDVQPNEMISFDGKAGQIQPASVTVVANGGEPFDIVTAETNDTHYKVTVAPNIVPEVGKPTPKPVKAKTGTLGSGMSSYTVTVTPAADLPIGRGNAQVTLKTSHPKAAEVLIRISSYVRGEVDVLPERVTLRLGSTQPEAAKVQHVAIRKREGSPLKILGVESSNPAIKTTLKTVTAGQEYDLEVRYDGPPPAAVINADVTIKTDDPRQSAIKVTVYGFPEAQVVAPGQQGDAHVVPIPVAPAVPAKPPAH